MENPLLISLLDSMCALSKQTKSGWCLNAFQDTRERLGRVGADSGWSGMARMGSEINL